MRVARRADRKIEQAYKKNPKATLADVQLAPEERTIVATIHSYLTQNNPLYVYWKEEKSRKRPYVMSDDYFQYVAYKLRAREYRKAGLPVMVPVLVMGYTPESAGAKPGKIH